ncbi:MAG: cytochrome c [Myxococcales bacterium]|nr:cytochrome c [Myxococcales bacterium]
MSKSSLDGVRRTLLAVVAALLVWTSTIPAQAATGAENFNATCAACHTVGGGKRVGPDLKGVTERRSEEWLLKFIKSSQSVIKSGDPTATALFDEFKVQMPDTPYSPAEIKDILAYIQSGGEPAAAAPVRAATPDDIRKGQAIFQGIIRLKNGGPPCNSCHHVQNDAVIGGGVLAKELTTVFGTMGSPGVHAILGKPPFPVMAQAYKDRPITEDEVISIVAFLQDAHAKQAFQQPRDYGFRLLYGGAGGLLILMLLYSLIWRRRKTHPVNHEIFERQIRTE